MRQTINPLSLTRSTRPARGAASARHGFTLIELLVAISVILILIGIVVVGLRQVAISQQGNSTRITLSSLKSLLLELETSVGSLDRRQPGAWYPPGATSPVAVNVGGEPKTNAWRSTETYTSATAPTPVPLNTADLLAGGEIMDGPGNRDKFVGNTKNAGSAPFGLAPFRNTQLILGMLYTTRGGRASVTQLPQSQLQGMPEKGTPSTGANDRFRESDNPFILDAWGNPILFVPAAGLINVWQVDKPTSTAPATFTAANPLQAPNNRPFFVSAGPDGDFRTGDDNLYSFED